MVCPRCKAAVRGELERLGLRPLDVSLGEVTIGEEELSKEKTEELSEGLTALGFGLIGDRRSRLVEQIKTFIIDTIHYSDEQPKENYSGLLSRHLHHDYSYLSGLFSEAEGLTIEQYIIHQKIEKVKELLTYNEYSLAQIAAHLDYSSTAHLSAQFKKLTGLTPSQFRKSGAGRKPLDAVGKPE